MLRELRETEAVIEIWIERSGMEKRMKEQGVTVGWKGKVLQKRCEMLIEVWDRKIRINLSYFAL